MRTKARLSTAIALAGGLAAATLAVAAPAQAATGSFSGGVLTVSLSTPDWFRVQEDYSAPGTYLVVSDLGNAPASIPGCSKVSDYFRCAGVTTVVLNGSSGNDQLTVQGPVTAQVRGGAGNDELLVDEVVAAALHGDAGDDTLTVSAMASRATTGATFDGGDGNDTVTGSPLADTIRGGAGDDNLFGDHGDDSIFGDAGNDWLVGDAGSDLLDGGDGNDRLTGMAGADTYRGGPGADVADYWDQYSGQSGVVLSASLDGVANDGAAGEGDNINADGSVENIDTGDLNFTLDAVTLIGDDGPNHLKGYSPRSMTADGRGGDDLINVSSMQTGGRTTVQGGAGNDSITTSGETSTVDGGAGDDTIYSGKGHDTVTGGPGRDTIDTGYGNDTVNSRDGEVDSISCGVGADTLVGDKIDVVNADPLALCESQDLAKGPAPTPGAPDGTFAVKVPKRAKVSKKGVVKFRLANGLDNAVALKVVVKARKPRLTLGKAKAKVRANASRTVKVKLTKKAFRILKRKKRIKVTVVFTATKGARGTIRKKTVLRR